MVRRCSGSRHETWSSDARTLDSQAGKEEGKENQNKTAGPGMGAVSVSSLFLTMVQLTKQL